MRIMQRLKAVVVVHHVSSLVKCKMAQWQASTSCMVQVLMNDITLLPNLAFCYGMDQNFGNDPRSEFMPETCQNKHGQTDVSLLCCFLLFWT